MAKAALEMALLDASSGAGSRSPAGSGRRPSGGPGGRDRRAGSPGEVVAAVGRAVEAGYTRVKCKIAPGLDVARSRAVRGGLPATRTCRRRERRLPPRATRPTGRRSRPRRLGLVALEQPLAPEDLARPRRARRRLETPVLLDESVDGEGDLETAIALAAL